MKDIEVGDRVLILAGAFTGHVGVVTTVWKPYDARVLLEGAANAIRKDLFNLGPAYSDHLLVDEGL